MYAAAPVPTVFDHVLFAVLAVLFPIRAATFGYRRLERAPAPDLPRVRRSVYAQAMGIQWLLTVVVLGLWVRLRRPWGSLGLVPHVTWGLIGVGLGLVIVVMMVARQRRHALEDDEALERLRGRFRHVQRMLPTTPAELSAFYRLSITAGICEELLYRGYVIWYLSHALSFWPAALASSVVFGLGHAYQGPRGMMLTGAVGMFMAGVYWVSGSLLAPMVLHAAMDAHSGNVLYHALAREREAAAAGVTGTPELETPDAGAEPGDESPGDVAEPGAGPDVPVTPPPG